MGQKLFRREATTPNCDKKTASHDTISLAQIIRAALAILARTRARAALEFELQRSIERRAFANRARLKTSDENALQVLAGRDGGKLVASSRFLQSRYWAREVWHFVPDDLPLREMSICWPSGTTGSEAAMKVTLHPLQWRSKEDCEAF